MEADGDKKHVSIFLGLILIPNTIIVDHSRQMTIQTRSFAMVVSESISTETINWKRFILVYDKDHKSVLSIYQFTCNNFYFQ